jgi:hypothetical protein
MSVATSVKPPPGSVRTTRGQDLVTSILAAWITTGGFVDGFAHRNLDALETFFTPWHGILYSGYLATAAWILWLVARNRSAAPSLSAAIPDGYGTALTGVAVFAAGGLGDMAWHIAFGVETSLDALLSPTHLMLLVGSLLMVSGPIRACWRDTGYEPVGLAEFWPPLLAVTMGAAQLGFFFQYIDGFSSRLMQVPYRPGGEAGFFETATGIAAILITTIIMTGGLLLLMRRWRVPLGTGLVLFGLLGVLMEVLEGYEFPEDVVAPLAAGVVADLLIRWLRPSPERLASVRAVLFAIPVTLWSIRFAVFEQFSDINWPIEIWTGTIVFAGLAGIGLSLLTFPAAGRASS